MISETKVITGLVRRDPYGSWDDCSPGLYIDSDMVETIFREYKGKNIRVTIEEIKEESNAE
jgi:hypothetical protein